MTKRLYKSKEKKIFGVCGGLAEYFDLDPTVMRLIFVAAVLLFGTGILLYIIMAIIMPEKSLEN
jgi:phage shock protein C